MYIYIHITVYIHIYILILLFLLFWYNVKILNPSPVLWFRHHGARSVSDLLTWRSEGDRQRFDVPGASAEVPTGGFQSHETAVKWYWINSWVIKCCKWYWMVVNVGDKWPFLGVLLLTSYFHVFRAVFGAPNTSQK